MKWRRFNRSLALLLSVVMAFSLQIGGGGTAFAGAASNVIENTTTGVRYTDVGTALSAAADGQTVALIANAFLANAVTYSRPGVGVTLDLNGYRMVREVYGGGETGTDGAVYVSAGVLTICDTSAAADGYIEYLNLAGYSGSGLNLGAGGTVKLLSGGILGTGQSVYAHDAGSRFEMSGGVVYGSGAHSGSEAIAAVSGAYVTISGGYIGTKNPDAAMIWSGAALDPAYWSITGGYFTSKYYSDGGQKEIANFVTQGKVTELDAAQTYAAISGATEYKYHLTMPRTVAFDGNGGDSPVTTLVTDLSGKLDALPGAAVKSGAEFIGWFTAAAGGEQVTADYIFNRDMTVYAQYRGPGIDYKAEQLSGLTPGAGYKLTDASSVTGATYITADTSGNIAVEEAWLSGSWSLEEDTGGGTPAWSVLLPPRPAAPTGVNAGSVSEAGAADGKLTGLNKNMQYRIKGTGPWTTATGPAATGLAAGMYEVRTSATMSSFASAPVEVTVGVLVPPALSAVGDNENNLVKLNWTSSLAGQEYYMVYQRDTGGDGLDEFQSIPLKNDIKVLNVYPDMPGSDGLQNWMSTWGNPSGYTMQVDKVSMSDFNGDDPAVNYAHYLAKDDNGAYAYDVLYFGAWDANNRRDLSGASHEAVEAFIRYGGGVLMGHDTASFNHEHLIDLAAKYLNLDVKFQEGYPDPEIPTTGGTRVVVERRGFPMNYPYALGDVGTVLSVPQSHSYFQFAKGDVWFKYSSPDWGSTREITSYNGNSGTNNFYLTTWNNAALIQTGHSNGRATTDEQKILANTLFYLAQTSTSNSFADRMSQDVAAPDAVSGPVRLTYDSVSGRPMLSWNEPKDNGSSYAYYLKAVSYVDGSSRQSSETTATVTTGVQGYAVTIDTDPEGNDPGNTVTTATYSYVIPGTLDRGVTYYAHIKTIDRAGNISQVYTLPFNADASGLTAVSTDPAGKSNDGKTKLSVLETVMPGNRLVYLNVKDGNVEIPAVGEELSGYTAIPDNGLVEAANGDKIAVAELDASGKVVRFGQTVAKVLPSPAALPVASVDPAGAVNDGKTRMIAGARSGNKLVYVNFARGEVTEPSLGEELTGYTDLPADGVIPAERGDRIGIAEVDADGKVIRYGVAEAEVSSEAEAKGLSAAASDPSGSGTDGKTRVSASAASGNKLVVVNFKREPVRVPDTGSSLEGLGYTELAADGLVDADHGDYLGIAEVDASGKVVRFAALQAVVEAEDAATGLSAVTTDPSGAGTDGKTKLSVQTPAADGNKLVYMNFGRYAVQKPSTGDTLEGYLVIPEDGLIPAADGDHIGVAEIDASGKVVKYGVTTALVVSDSAAGGLTVTSSDPAGASNDGLTLISAQAETGNTLLYVNFGQGLLLTPETGELMSGYLKLPENGLIAAREGDRIAVAEVDAAGRVVRFGWVNAVVADEPVVVPPVETTPTPTPIPSATPAPGGGTGPAVTPAPAASVKPSTQSVEVLVNGKVEYAGIASITRVNQQVVTTIDVDPAKLQAKLDAAGRGAVVTIPWTAASDIVIGQLTGQMIRNMEEQEATLVLDTPAGAYKIPASQIRMARLADQLGSNVRLEDITLQVHIELFSAEAAKAAEAKAAKQGATLAAAPVTFTVNAVYAGKSIEIKDYSIYVERTVALPQGVDPNKITTGVVLEPDGTLRHVPTKVTKVAEVYYAQINSVTNSDYAVVWHPLEFADVASHWSRNAVNDMGSRLVVNGVDEGVFQPNADITRAEFAAILVRGLGLRLEQGAAPFSDVDSSRWYASAVNTAYRTGLISGYEDHSFRPQGKITRQEAMTMTARAMSITGLKGKVAGADAAKVLEPYKDASSVAGWAQEAVTYSVAAQVMKGRTASTLDSRAFITRAEVAAVVQRLLQQSGLI
ncbi:S-layer homology domain-containing protein [Paenibacillus piscarius]|uniref:S-layer homology domain-containing protein n=1 Tax=Paenibacillus piscarius TaxID=1089681 RepID=UPI001EE8F27D|nr:S-layer homology domain-containing protein [Paenibacillus piscarius]